MAGKRLRLRGSIWYGTVYIDGKRVERPTGGEDETEAELVLAGWEEQAQAAADPDHAASTTTLDEILTLLVNERKAKAREGEGSEENVEFHETKAGHLVRVLGHSFLVSQLSTAVIWKYIDHRRDVDDATNIAINKELRWTLRAALYLAKGRGLWSGDVDTVIPREWNPKGKVKTRSPTREEILKLIPHLGPAKAAAVCFALATTAEMSALRNALRSDLPTTFDEPAIAVHVRGTKNKDRDRFVPIVTHEQQTLLEFSAKYADGTDGKLFGSWLENFRRHLVEAADAVGIEALSPHDLRRAGGQWLVDLHLPLDVLSKVMGHRSPVITAKVYARIKDGDLIERMFAGIDSRYLRPVHREAKPVETIKALPLPRMARSFTVDGVTGSLQFWAERSGLSKGTLHGRLQKGLSMADAIARGKGGMGVRLAAPLPQIDAATPNQHPTEGSSELMAFGTAADLPQTERTDRTDWTVNATSSDRESSTKQLKSKKSDARKAKGSSKAAFASPADIDSAIFLSGADGTRKRRGALTTYISREIRDGLGCCQASTVDVSMRTLVR